MTISVGDFMARIYPICSSSKGNCTFVGTRGHGILIDAGSSFKSIKNSLDLIDTRLENIEAVFITHEHGDHIKGLEQFLKHTKIPVFAPAASAEKMKSDEIIPEDAQIFDCRVGYKSAAFEVSCFQTSHDSVDSVGYIIKYNKTKIGICTDTGVVTEQMNALKGCRAVLIESNYDENMLRHNLNYSPALKRRIMSEDGHLSNDDCAGFCAELVKSGTRHLILGHLSQENNTPQTALGCVKRRLEECGLKLERDYSLMCAPVVTNGDYLAI